MILVLNDLICTRWHVEQLAKDNHHVTEIDFTLAQIAGVSTMHQFVLSFPNAKLTGLEGWNAKQYEWVVEAINSEEWKRNQVGNRE
jgi:hypothetical protein